MLVDSTSTNAAGVASAIRQAAGTTGASFRYLLATAQIESGLNPNIKASTSSATGLFQFIDQTWLATMKDSGASLGYGKYSAAITRTKSGRLFVKDASMRREIMGLRKDPTANALMAGAFTKQNAATLRGKIGREPTEGELYMAHFLGAGGATKLINAARQHPDAKATSLFPRAARSNNSIFYDKQGKARTTSQVYAALAHKLDAARAKTDPAAATAVAVPPVSPPGGTVPVTASVPPRPLPMRGITPPSAIFSTSPTPVRTISFLPPSVSGVVAPASNTAPVDPTATAGSVPDAPVPADAPAASVGAVPAGVPPVPVSTVPADVPSVPVSALPASAPDSTTAPVPQAASYAPDNGPVFFDLFRSDGRQAVSPLVSELWGSPPRSPAGDATAVPPVVNTSAPTAPSGQPPGAPPLDLFNAGHPQRPRFDRSS